MIHPRLASAGVEKRNVWLNNQAEMVNVMIVSIVAKENAFWRKVSKGELDVRMPMCEWAIRSMMTGRMLPKIHKVRRPVGPIGNQAHMTYLTVS